MALIDFSNFNFIYPGADDKSLKNINFQLESGDFLLICGPSGCGKTTLLKQLIPAVAPYGTREGHILFDGEDLYELSDADMAGRVGYVGQNPLNQLVTDKVWHELAFGMENLGTSQEIMERRIAEVCEFFGMQKWLDRDVATLSGGEMQMVHLASIMVMEPEVLLLDEPTAQLDPLAARNFLDMIKRINAEIGTTIILVEHHLEDAYGMADKVMAMTTAEIDCFGNPREVAGKLKFMSGLPSALLIAKSVEENDEHLPLTVAEGQRWMRDRMKAKSIDEVTILNEAENIISQFDENNISHNDRDDISYDTRGNISQNAEILRIKDICFAYSDEDIVLNDCNLSVHKGEIYALLGGNGTGKSTLLKVLCQTEKPVYGSVEIFGKKVKGLADAPLGYEGMVFLPQDPMALFTEITVWEEMIETFDGMDIGLSEKEKLAETMLEDIGLIEYKKFHPYDLSGGQQQLLAIGKLLLLKPQIILMDEPTKGLDFDRKIQLGDRLKKLAESGITILMVSHDIEFCARFATRCGMMHDGRVVASSSAREFFAGNNFFTTATNRMVKRFLPKFILPEEVIAFCKM
ncbi:MAG: ATP-binding cassette domain-containing protein [Lachnospiraceae bacterium]|nr:ATP-binding cassette domain-containing protein [Lachnospiraceae bacterium]